MTTLSALDDDDASVLSELTELSDPSTPKGVGELDAETEEEVSLIPHIPRNLTLVFFRPRYIIYGEEKVKRVIGASSTLLDTSS